jgi:hypothetical protein
MQRKLNYGAMPPIWVPLAFLLAAPCFALAAAILLAWHGEAALVSRWTPLTLAMTHLLTLGCLTMTIVGALFQLLPVVAGAAIPLARPVAVLGWTGLTAGTVVLACALGLGLGPAAFHAAAAVLGLAGLLLLAALGVALARRSVPGARPLVRGVRLAVAGLAVTVGLGGTLALYLGGVGAPDALLLTDIHASWGLLGWVVALTAAVSFQVIPMFQGTASYAPSQETGMPALLFALLLGWSGAALAGAGYGRLAVEIGLGMLLLWYAWTTLMRFRGRKRKADVGTCYWVQAMACLAAAVLVHFLPLDSDSRALMTGILVIAGFAMSAINGMLYKIVPFLVWYHLQETAGAARARVPGIRSIIDEARALRQWRWHLVAFGLLAAAPLAPSVLARPAGLFQGLAMLFLIRDLGGAALLYLRLRRP